MKDILVVSATRKTRAEFRKDSPLAASLQKLQTSEKISSRITYQNQVGLSTIYNRYLKARYANKILAFVHDDVSIEDLFFFEKLNSALKAFDVIGLAGNREPQPDCLSWYDLNQPLAGFVAHALDDRSAIPASDTIVVSSYGPTPAECGFLDGLFLAINTETILKSKAVFDEQFEFHFYDLDFCLSCASKGLKLGTWPLWAVHESGGSFDSPEWKKAAASFREKWKLPGQ